MRQGGPRARLLSASKRCYDIVAVVAETGVDPEKLIGAYEDNFFRLSS